MATPLQRFTAICDALVDGTATVAQRTALADAFVYEADRDGTLALLFPGVPAASLTDSQKAAVAVAKYVQHSRAVWRAMRQAASVQAAAAEVAPL
jgi:orotidine-5'-phosphate decarboxylase